MNPPVEHDDDLEPEVDDGADVETVGYPDEEDLERSEQGRDLANPPGRVQDADEPLEEEEEEHESDRL